MAKSLRNRLFGLSTAETTFARRRFRGDNRAAQPRLECIGATFLYGYHTALDEDRPAALEQALASVENEMRGFAYEGAAMGLALRDLLTPWRQDRLRAFLAGPGEAHVYMIHVGAGWLPARLGLPVQRFTARLDPLLRWLALDGYGFHQGYFHWPRYVDAGFAPYRLSGYARRAFDQGLGRSLWFVDGADVARIPVTISTFPLMRRPDLWSGVGLACAYAGGASRAEIEALCAASGPFLPQVAQGAAFAAQARRRADTPAEHTALACRILCRMSAEDAAQTTEEALQGLTEQGFNNDSAEPAYERWRQRIQARFAFTEVTVP